MVEEAEEAKIRGETLSTTQSLSSIQDSPPEEDFSGGPGPSEPQFSNNKPSFEWKCHVHIIYFQAWRFIRALEFQLSYPVANPVTSTYLDNGFYEATASHYISGMVTTGWWRLTPISATCWWQFLWHEQVNDLQGTRLRGPYPCYITHVAGL
jgi:hypothetical protein